MTALADRLETLQTYLEKTTEDLRRDGIAPTDLGPLATYLLHMAEHGEELAKLGTAAIDAAGSHALQTTEDGVAVQINLGHVAHLLDAAGTFAAVAAYRLRNLNADPS